MPQSGNTGFDEYDSNESANVNEPAANQQESGTQLENMMPTRGYCLFREQI